MIVKRLFDIMVSALALVVLTPILVPAMLAVWLQDFHAPFYLAPRAGRGGKPFRMVKLRSMIVNADRSGVHSTAGDDRRITRVGGILRRLKLDELPQLWNVLKGEMSLVGPRPQVLDEVAGYSEAERRLLTVRPGITDPASIVFADEGEILRGSADPDGDYQRLIRPWKSRLALAYVGNRSLAADLRLVWLTAVGLASRRAALRGVQALLRRWGAEQDLVEVAGRKSVLAAAPLPGGETNRHAMTSMPAGG